MEYSENALKIYQKLYLNKKLNEKQPNDVHRRVAEFISNNDAEEIKFFEILRTKSFRPNTPTLINAGTTSTNPLDQQLMACFIYKLEDSMDSIIDMWGTLSRIYASGAGAGINITNLRERGSPISSSGQASGPLAYLQVLEIVSQTVMAGGKNRRAANLAVFRHDHPDTLEILDSKRDKKSLRSFNISMLAPDNFMAMICNDVPKEDIKYESPNPISKIYTDPISPTFLDPHHLWNKVIENAWETGDPGLLFIDTANKFNPFPSRGKINCANACVTGNTLILTNNGYKEIQDCINKETIIWNGFEWSSVIPRITGYNQKVMRIKFSDGTTLNCTHYHKFKLKNGVEKEAKDLLINDKIEKCFYPVIHSGKDDEYCYTQGFFAGDGYYKRDNPNIWLYSEKKKVLPILKYKLVNEKEERFNVYLERDKIREKTFVPNTNWSVKSRLEFLSGIIDSDGCSTIDGSIQITSIKRNFLEKIKYMLNTLGTISKLNLRSRRGWEKLPKNDGSGRKKKYFCKTSYRLTIASSQVSKLLDLGLKTYRVKLSLCNPNREAQHFIYIKELIKSNQLEEKVYCFTEPKNNTGIFNGIYTGQCQEIPLPDWSACVLGAINLNNCLKQTAINKLSFNWEELERLTKLGVRFLDNVIDKTSYLHPKFEEEMKATRPIGLGIMGLADVFIKLEIPYNSDEAIDLFRKICKCLTKTAIRKSIKLAKEKGDIVIPDKDWEHFKNLLRHYGCNHNDIANFEDYGIRNCTWTTCQPTGTTALSADCSYSFEPLSAIVWQKELAETHEIMTFVNPEFERYVENFIINHLDENTKIKSRKSLYKRIIKNNGSIKGIGDIPKNVQEIFVTAHDINPLDKLNMQAAGQRYISLGISSTCNLPNHATKHDIEKIFTLAWKLGLKGITIYRDQCLDWQPINFGEKKIKIPTIDKDGKVGILTLDNKEFEEIKEEFFNKESDKEWLKGNFIGETKKPNNKRPVTRNGKTFEIETPHGRLYLTLNKDNNNKPLEAFLRLGKSGKLENLLLDTLGRVISKNLQSGVPFNEISSLLRGTREDKFWFRLFEDQEEPFAAESIIDAIGIIMDSYYNDIEKANDKTLKEKAPHELMTNVCYYSECPVCKKFTLSHDTGCRSGQCINQNCLFTSCG